MFIHNRIRASKACRIFFGISRVCAYSRMYDFATPRWDGYFCCLQISATAIVLEAKIHVMTHRASGHCAVVLVYDPIYLKRRVTCPFSTRSSCIGDQSPQRESGVYSEKLHGNLNRVADCLARYSCTECSKAVWLHRGSPCTAQFFSLIYSLRS